MAGNIELAAPYYLPVLQEGSEVSYARGLGEAGGWSNFRDLQHARLRDENEWLATMLTIQGQLVPHPEDRNAAATTRLITYGLLAHQAELDVKSGLALDATGMLPVVTESTTDSFGEGAEGEEAWQQRCQTAFDRLTLHNGHLANVVGFFMRSSGVTLPRSVGEAREALMFTHAFLDIQATRDAEKPSATEVVD